MLSWFRTVPIKRKLTLIAMLTSSSALLLAYFGFAVHERYAFRRWLSNDLANVAQMTAYNSASALTFNDPASAAQTLQALAAKPHIVGACIYDHDGKVFADYRRQGKDAPAWPPRQANAMRFGPDRLELFCPIENDHEIIGTLYLRSDLGELHERMQDYALLTGGVMLAAGLLAYLIAARLRRVIADPIAQLATVAARVAADKDYSLRVERTSDDELGRLTEVFNEMLTHIQARDIELSHARDQLERRVEERTQELTYERDQLRALLDSSPDAIYFKDQDCRLVRISRSKADKMLACVPGLRERLLGPDVDPSAPVALGSFVGLSDADTYSEENAQQALADEREIMRTGRPLFGKTEKKVFLDGTVAWSLTSKMPWYDQKGRIIGTFGISKDITELKLAEEQLERAHRQLLDTSRAAGMAEVATGVLHNVGNVLNSVNVSATLVADVASHSKISNVGKLAALLAEHESDLAAFFRDDPRGKMIQPYLTSLAEDLAQERQSMLTELEQLRKNVDHIKDIVAMQQNYARTSGVIEAISIPDLVEDALRMNAGSLARHDIDLVRDYQVRPVVALDKHKVLQILINLIRNAKYACDESGRPDKCITVRVTADRQRVSIAVVDNGIGIPAENLTRIFNHGFTTRARGHGFGLHSGALAAKEMGGSLEVLSEGPGRGASFVLSLPFKPEGLSHESSFDR